MAKKQVEEEVKEESLLRQLCGDDVKIYECLTNHLYENPSSAISVKDMDTLIDEADKSGKFGPALDKAIFEASQNPSEKQKYEKIIQSLGLKTAQAAVEEKDTAEKDGLTERVTLLEKRIESQKLLSERTADIIDIAEKFYAERLAVGKADGIRDERNKERNMAERQQMKIVDQDRSKRMARLREIKAMGRKERKKAMKEYKAEEQAAEAAKEARLREREIADKEESRLGEVEQSARDERKKERS